MRIRSFNYLLICTHFKEGRGQGAGGAGGRGRGQGAGG